MLVDEVIITVKAGKGGNGSVHFRREKYVPKGGPDGGDGGDGGDVVLVADPALHTLAEYARKRDYVAEDGEGGKPKKMHGKNGKDTRLRVLPGTLVFEGTRHGTDVRWHELADLTTAGQELRVARGGKGGRGNVHFATATYQTPMYAEPGKPGEEKLLKLELKLIADIGLIGLPNAGKSSLLARTSAAKPKIADYPFTTLEPNLGVVELGKVGLSPREVSLSRPLILADIPGLIAGASQGKGLGDQFLRHIERTLVLVHLIDASHQDPVTAYTEIRQELAAWQGQLSDKAEIVVLSKIDVVPKKDLTTRRRALAKYLGAEPLLISSATGTGLPELVAAIIDRREALTAAQDALDNASENF